MNLSDQHIKQLFSEKLGNLESPVDPGVWMNIESTLPQPAVTSASATAAKVVVSKWIIAGIVAAVIVTTSILVLNREADVNTATPSEQIEKEKAPETANSALVTENTELPTSAIVTAEQNETTTVIEKKEIQNAGIENQPAHEKPLTGTLPNSPQENENVPMTNASSSHNASATPDPELRGAPAAPSAVHEFNAEFNVQLINEDELMYFFFPKYPDELAYHWQIGTCESTHDISSSFRFETEGNYEVSLTVTSQKGIEKSYTETIEAWYPAKLKVPNVFSPNNDNLNSCFDVLAESQHVILDKLVIMDASGSIMFESTSDQTCWDGNNKYGNPCSEGTYRCSMRWHDRSGKPAEYNGTLNLLRN